MASPERISGYDLSRVLIVVGYRLVGATGGYACMQRGEDALMVPQADSLDVEQLHTLLTNAKLDPHQFVTLLRRLGDRDTLPEIDPLVVNGANEEQRDRRQDRPSQVGGFGGTP